MNQSIAKRTFDLVLVASSTGGPIALEKLFSGFSKPIRQPVLVVQHMPPEFTRILAQTLQKKSPLSFAEAKKGDWVRPGLACVAPGGFHMVVKKDPSGTQYIDLENSPNVNGVKPAADVLFESVAKVFANSKILVVIMTGMGSDGTKGVKALKETTKCYCITQSAESCVVYGMPRSVYNAGLSDEVASLESLPKRMQSLLNP